MRHGWDNLRPLPRPHYVSPVPNTGGAAPLEPFFPPTISTIAEAALSREAAEFVMRLLEKLTPNDESRGQELFYRWAHGKFGKHWRYADSTTVLTAASMALRPRTYLEIGVRRGRSIAVVAATAPGCAIYGFDLWLEGYAGLENPGPNFVRGELRAAGSCARLRR